MDIWLVFILYICTIGNYHNGSSLLSKLLTVSLMSPTNKLYFHSPFSQATQSSAWLSSIIYIRNSKKDMVATATVIQKHETLKFMQLCRSQAWTVW